MSNMLIKAEKCRCGSEASVYETFLCDIGFMFQVKCEKCKSSGPVEKTAGVAIVMWNRIHGPLNVAALDMLKALILAEQFIANGIDFDYIVMPEENDPALETLSKIRSAIMKARGQS